MMVLHPEAQNRAHAEIDAITKGSRIPDFNDQPDLPFVGAVLSETLRRYPPSPLGALLFGLHSVVNLDPYSSH